MRERLRKLIEEKQKLALVAVVAGAVILTLWINSAGSTPQGPPQDWTTSVPQGFLVVPLNLSNGRIIAKAIEQTAVMDIFKSGQQMALAENLRVIRLGDDPPSFGAMVPEKMSGQLQPVLSGPGLTAAIRTSHSGPSKFHLFHASKTLLREIVTGD
jgi:hypothetical protein